MDVMARLPAAAKAKYQQILDEQQDTRAVIQQLSRQRGDAATEKGKAESYLNDLLETRRSSGGRTTSSFRSAYIAGARSGLSGGAIEMSDPEHVAAPRQIADAEQRLAEATAEVSRLNGRIEAAQGRLSRLPDAIKAYIESIPAGVRIEPYDGLVTPPAAVSFEALAALRERIAAKVADVRAVRSAPPPSADVKRAMREQVATIAARGAPDYLAAVEMLRPIKLPELSVQSQVAVAIANGVGVGYHQTADAYGFLFWLFGDVIAKRMETDIEYLCGDDEGALTEVEKAEKEQELRQELFNLELSEEALIEQLGSVSRRENADPRAVLGLSSELPAPTI
jgi:hypothetical protein